MSFVLLLPRVFLATDCGERWYHHIAAHPLDVKVESSRVESRDISRRCTSLVDHPQLLAVAYTCCAHPTVSGRKHNFADDFGHYVG